MKLSYVLLFLFAAANLFSFLICLYDKAVSKKNDPRRRVPEKRLWLLAFFFGAAGLYLGMLLARHKTRHRSFMAGVPLLALLQAGLLLHLLINV